MSKDLPVVRDEKPEGFFSGWATLVTPAVWLCEPPLVHGGAPSPFLTHSSLFGFCMSSLCTATQNANLCCYMMVRFYKKPDNILPVLKADCLILIAIKLWLSRHLGGGFLEFRLVIIGDIFICVLFSQLFWKQSFETESYDIVQTDLNFTASLLPLLPRARTVDMLHHAGLNPVVVLNVLS